MVDTQSIERQILIPYTSLDWSSVNGDVPVSPLFNDVYFSVEDGIAESRYHFIDGNDLENRFKNLSENTHFTILETGFGSGLNLLLTADLFLKNAPKTAHLHFVSVEGYPLPPNDMKKILQLALQSQHAKDLQISPDLIPSILGAYPPPCRGFHYRPLPLSNKSHSKRIHLNLYMGDIKDFIEELHTFPCGVADAVFLDGFAPAKNADMWQDTLFLKLPQLMKTGGTLATFTAAGFVRRSLENNGFIVHKTKGYGRKRERIIASYPLVKAPQSSPPQNIAIIGAGISGLTIAHACQQWGANVTVYNRDDTIMAGASGNPIGLIEPRLSNDNDATKHGTLNRAAYLHSVAYYDDLHATSQAIIGKKTIWSCKGLLFSPQSENEKKRLSRMIKKPLLPHEHMHFVHHEKAQEIAGVPVFQHNKKQSHSPPETPPEISNALIAYFPQAGGVYPHHIGQVLQHNITIHHNCEIISVKKEKDHWILRQKNGENSPPFDRVIICGGADSLHIHGLGLDTDNKDTMIRFNRGQISWATAEDTTKNEDSISSLKVAIGGHGYTTYDAPNHRLIFGATWDTLTPQEYANETWKNITQEGHLDNKNKGETLLPNIHNIAPENIQGRVAIRATVPDRMPLLGFLDDGLFLATGYGARGLQYAPLFAHICRNMLWKVFPPCFRKNIHDMNPKRFL